MPAIVLESALGSQYQDAPDSYEFPTRYLRHFEPVSRAEPLYAIIYEPRGAGTGRMGYVGFAQIASVPVSTGRRNRAGEELWRVKYSRPAEPFGAAVPREVLGDPVETWLRGLPRGRSRNVATFGRAVRALTDEDFERILGSPRSTHSSRKPHTLLISLSRSRMFASAWNGSSRYTSGARLSGARCLEHTSSLAQ